MEYISQEGPKDNWVLIEHCIDCKLPIEIKYKSFRLRKTEPKCHSCRSKKGSNAKSLKMKQLWQDKNYKKNVKTGLIKINKEEKNKKISQSMKEYFSNPVNKQMHFFNLDKIMQEKKKKISKAMKEKWKDDAYRNKVVESQKKNADELWGFKMDLRRKLNKLN